LLLEQRVEDGWLYFSLSFSLAFQSFSCLHEPKVRFNTLKNHQQCIGFVDRYEQDNAMTLLCPMLAGSTG
jgi:hypothetical protein